MGGVGYSAYFRSTHDLTLRESPAESDAAGVRVGRLEIPVESHVDVSQLRHCLLKSPYDVVVLRYPADNSDLAFGLNAGDLTAIQADTLLYFEASCGPGLEPRSSLTLREASSTHAQDVAALVLDVFGDYTNHYAANPLLQRISIADAYKEWVIRSIDNSESATLIASNTEFQDIGICMVDLSQEDYDEILLAGVAGEHRRQGHYFEMLKQVMLRSSSNGKSHVVISTQASNIAVMRAWCKLGFQPSLALNTLHVYPTRSITST